MKETAKEFAQKLTAFKDRATEVIEDTESNGAISDFFRLEEIP